jgi:hypothetical protein
MNLIPDLAPDGPRPKLPSARNWVPHISILRCGIVRHFPLSTHHEQGCPILKLRAQRGVLGWDRTPLTHSKICCRVPHVSILRRGIARHFPLSSFGRRADRKPALSEFVLDERVERGSAVNRSVILSESRRTGTSRRTCIPGFAGAPGLALETREVAKVPDWQTHSVALTAFFRTNPTDYA